MLCRASTITFVDRPAMPLLVSRPVSIVSPLADIASWISYQYDFIFRRSELGTGIRSHNGYSVFELWNLDLKIPLSAFEV